MAKIRVHELAKEINRTSKEVMEFFTGKGMEIKSAMSSVEDAQADMARQEFGVSPGNRTEKKDDTDAKQNEGVKAEKPKEKKQDKPEQAPVKKKKPNISFVSNTFNSKNADRRQGGKGRQVGQIGGSQNQGQGRPAQKRPAGRLPESGKSMKETVAAAFEAAMGETKKAPAKAPAPEPVRQEVKPAPVKDETVKQETVKPEIVKTEIAKTEPVKAEEKVTPPQKERSTEPAKAAPEARNETSKPQGDRAGDRKVYASGNRNNNQNRGNQERGGQTRSYSDRNGQTRNYQDRNSQDRRNNERGGQRTGAGQSNGRTFAGNQGGYQNGRGNNQGGNRDFRNGDNRAQGGRGNDRPGFRSQDSKRTLSFASEAAGKEQEKHRNDQDRRRQSQEKRKRDLAYERDDEVKAKKFNPHGFNKPEKTAAPPEEKIKVITLPESLTVKELAEKMKIQPAAIVKKLFLQGTIVTVNQEISYEQAEEIAIEYDIICEKEEKIDVIAELLKEEEEDEAAMTKRPPVVCVMGHVDHGKTSLLDAIRNTNVTDREAGGITQHIGAYVVNINGEKITFLDTPGHEAFTAMRMRGANSTDIAILVVAADDGVMPQTIEAINHAKAAGIEIIVAVNKIDKPSANIDRVKQELAEYELIPEDWGGSTVFAPVSAKTGEGVDQLLEMILLTAEILELKANAKRQARGLVIEAELDKGRGPVATVLVQKGVLHVGDFIAAGACHGKVRAMVDDKGRRVKEAGPSTPVEILGLNDVPNAGEIFVSPDNDKEAKNFAETFISQNKVKLLDDTKQKMSLDDLFSQIKEGNLKELNLIVKADVQGSVEAVKQSLVKLTNEEVVVKIIHGGVGAINESDVILASASNAIIIGFNVRPDATAKATAESEGVDVRLYKVIYQAIEDVEAAMKGMLDPVYEEKVIGHGEIRQIFKASGVGNIAGSYVLDGVFERGCSVRISREGEQIFEGALASLKRFKDDVKEVKAGFECGLVFEGFGDFAELDQVEAYKMVQVPR